MKNTRRKIAAVEIFQFALYANTNAATTSVLCAPTRDLNCLAMNCPRFLVDVNCEGGGDCQEGQELNNIQLRPMLNKSNKKEKLRFKYDGDNLSDAFDCRIASHPNVRKLCNISFVTPEEMRPPVLMFYEIEGFPSISSCPKTGSPVRNDYCMFNDVYTLSSSRQVNGVPLTLIEEDIASRNDLQSKEFQQPNGFRFQQCPTCEDCTCASKNWSDWSCVEPYVDTSTGNCFLYNYPNDSTTTYPYEQYPMVIRPIDGLQNEHYMVWVSRMMRSASPKKIIRNLYGWINETIPAETRLVVKIEANWAVQPFHGSKTLVITSNHICDSNSCCGSCDPDLQYLWDGCAPKKEGACRVATCSSSWWAMNPASSFWIMSLVVLALC